MSLVFRPRTTSLRPDDGEFTCKTWRINSSCPVASPGRIDRYPGPRKESERVGAQAKPAKPCGSAWPGLGISHARLPPPLTTTMSPSRGLPRLLPALNRALSSFPTLAASQTPLQVYISTSHSPFLNLSIEHYLFQTTPEKSTVLFLYTNGPSIIIGRNQNPWVEVSLPLLHTSPSRISLVRRRSGGGTVFHDLGNVNYSVCMPSARFNRDVHAEMVVRALHGLGVGAATVNARHDIVLLPAGTSAAGTKMLQTPEGTRKVSGSAFKLARLRSYHHGTMLLDSRLEDVRSYLRSPARGWLKARGVDSVRSPVANVGVEREAFVDAVVKEFEKMYSGGEGGEMGALDKAIDIQDKPGIGVCYVGEEALEVAQIGEGVEELQVRVSLQSYYYSDS